MGLTPRSWAAPPDADSTAPAIAPDRADCHRHCDDRDAPRYAGKSARCLENRHPPGKKTACGTEKPAENSRARDCGLSGWEWQRLRNWQRDVLLPGRIEQRQFECRIKPLSQGRTLAVAIAVGKPRVVTGYAIRQQMPVARILLHRYSGRPRWNDPHAARRLSTSFETPRYIYPDHAASPGLQRRPPPNTSAYSLARAPTPFR